MKLYLRNLEPGRDAEFSLEALEEEYTLTLQFTDGEMTSDGKMNIFQELINARKIIKEFKYGDEKEVLIELNKKELPKLVEKTREIQNAIATINSDMSVMIEHLKNELDTLNELQRKFYLWFKSKDVSVLGLDARLKVEPSVKEDTNDAQWAIADDMRKRKEEGQFDTYIEAYRWAQDNMTQDGEPIIAERLQNAFLKARCEGKVD